MSSRSFSIKVPASSANIGPGFDTLGLALGLYLNVTVNVSEVKNNETDDGFPYKFEIKYKGDSPEIISTDPDKNLITQTISLITLCLGDLCPKSHFKVDLNVQNPIPLGRGLGSSGAAVVAGVLIADQLAQLNLTQQQCIDIATVIEGHPDNVAASILGGLVSNCVKIMESTSSELTENQRIQKQLHDIVRGKLRLVYALKSPFSTALQVVPLVPGYHLSTEKSRQALPPTYSREEAIFNLQRVALLSKALGDEKPDIMLIHECLKDQLHQPYRKDLVLGFENLQKELVPNKEDGIAGVCISGAGPTILGICLREKSNVLAQRMLSLFNDASNGTVGKIMFVDVCSKGSKVTLSLK